MQLSGFAFIVERRTQNLEQFDSLKQRVSRPLYRAFHLNDVLRPDAVAPAGISPGPNIQDEAQEFTPFKYIAAEINETIGGTERNADRLLLRIFRDNSLNHLPIAEAFRLLTKLFLFRGEGIKPVHLTDETAKIYPMYGTHKVSDPGRLECIGIKPNRGRYISGALRTSAHRSNRGGYVAGALGQLTHGPAEIVGKKETNLEKQHVRIDIKKAECYLSVAQ